MAGCHRRMVPTPTPTRARLQVVHLHTRAAVAVSCLKEGFMCLDQNVRAPPDCLQSASAVDYLPRREIKRSALGKAAARWRRWPHTVVRVLCPGRLDSALTTAELPFRFYQKCRYRRIRGKSPYFTSGHCMIFCVFRLIVCRNLDKRSRQLSGDIQTHWVRACGVSAEAGLAAGLAATSTRF